MYRKIALFLFCLSVLAGCVVSTASNQAVTIENYETSEYEKELLSKTGVNSILYYKLNGVLREDEDLEISVQKYKNGLYEQTLTISKGEVEKEFGNTLLSFTVDYDVDHENGKASAELVSGLPQGTASGEIEEEDIMTVYGLHSTVDSKIALKKNVPLIIGVWAGASNGNLKTGGFSEDAKIPESVKENELAYVYVVELTDSKEGQ